MTTTAAELQAYALTRLNVVGDGQTPTAEQSKKVARNLNALHAYLQRQGYIDYEIEDIPDEDVDSMVTLLAWRARLDFSASAERVSALATSMPGAQRVLFANNQVEYNNEPVKALYF